MSIQEHLNKIRNAIYGREVRESIAKGIETAYDDASEKDNANMEVKIARGTNPNLNTRLNKMDETDSQNTEKIDSNYNEVTAQLAQKANDSEVRKKTVPIGLNDVATDLLEAVQNKEGTSSFELLSIPRRGSVTFDTTDFIRTSSNLADVETTIEGYSINGTTGELQESTTYSAQEKYVPVKAETIYKTYAIMRVAFYNIDKQRIGSVESGLGIGEGSFTTPTKCEFIRYHIRTDQKNSGQINEGDTLLPFEPFYARMEKVNIGFEDVDTDTTKIQVTDTDFIETSTNLFNHHEVTRGKAISGGGFVDNPTHSITGWIPAKPLTNYTLRTFERFSFYDENKNHLRTSNNYQDVSTSRSPAGTAYLVAHYVHSVSNTDDLQINEGSTLLDYEPYYVRFNEDILTFGSPSSGGGSTYNVSSEVFFEVSGLSKDTGLITNSDVRNYEDSRRTGNYINVVGGTSFGIEFDKGIMSIFEYDSQMNFLGHREVESGSTSVLRPFTNYVKLMVENLVMKDVVNCKINYTSPSPQPEETKNKKVDDRFINFTYEVDTHVGGDILSTNSPEEQYTTERYYNSGLLKLPKNYSTNGKPVKLIIFNQGAGGYLKFDTKGFNYIYDPFYQYLVDEGYAVLFAYHMTTKYEAAVENGINMGSPITMSALKDAYKWAINNYNIAENGVFVAGKSAGGYNGFNLAYDKGVPVKAVGLLAPAISPLGRPFGYAYDTRLAYVDDFGFEGDSSLLEGGGYPSRTQALKDYIISNAKKMIGYNPYWNGIINKSIEELALLGAEGTENNPENFEGVVRVTDVPQKIWIAEDDIAVSYNQSKIYIQTIKNGQGIGELRTMPTGTGGHYAVDSDENALKVDRIVTQLGIEHTDVPLAYVELIQFFRRFES